MRKARFIVLGIVIGVVAEIGTLLAAFAGTNLFHGGHANGVANSLLPGIAIVEHLSGNVPAAIPVFLLVMSLFQFPLYGLMAGLDYGNKALSKITIGVLVLHFCGSVQAVPSA